MNGRQEKYAHVISTSGNLLKVLLDDLIELSKMESGKLVLRPTNVNLSELVDRIVEMLREKAREKNLELVCRNHVPMGLEVAIDGQRFQQILVNLIYNAIKYTEKGKITVEAKVEDRKLVLAVTDTGIGIAAQHLENLFESFYQVSRPIGYPEQGSGLGLAICKNLIHLMGGEIRVESEEGKGSCFSVRLHLGSQQFSLK